MFVAAYFPGRIKRTLKHPMLAGVKIWALAHLLANGDLGSILLFGSILAWAVVARISVKRRDEVPRPRRPGGASGRAARRPDRGRDRDRPYASPSFWLHPWLIGVPVLAGRGRPDASPSRSDCDRRPTRFTRCAAAKGSSFMAENDEFIREVDEEYRRDRIAQIWKRYNGLIIGARRARRRGGRRLALLAAHASAPAPRPPAARFEEALRLARDDKGEEAEQILEALAKEAAAGYRLLARFRLAAETRPAATPRTARRPMTRSPPTPTFTPLWQDLARLRAAMLRLDTAEAGSGRGRRSSASRRRPNAWRHTARETARPVRA